MRNWLNAKNIILLLILFFLNSYHAVFADYSSDNSAIFNDKSRIVLQQIALLKTRYLQAKNELEELQKQYEQKNFYISEHHVNKQLMDQVGLQVSVIRSNLDNINIELAESQYAINRLEKDIQEIDNQLNVFSIFSLKIMNYSTTTNLESLKSELVYQKNLLQLEKTRENYLIQLRSLSDNELQLYKKKYNIIDFLLKNQTLSHLKKQQEKKEADFQLQQSYWLNRLNLLHEELNALIPDHPEQKVKAALLEREIFYADEYVNFTYLQALIARYQDQLLQLKVSINHSNSIALLNKVGEQIQQLGKQLVRMQNLLTKRVDIVLKHQSYLAPIKAFESDANKLNSLVNQYQAAIVHLNVINKDLAEFRKTLDQALQQELSARQGLPGLSAKAWEDLGEEIILIPTLTFQVIKSLCLNTGKSIQNIHFSGAIFLLFLELMWFGIFYIFKKQLARLIPQMSEQESGHINFKRVLIQVLHRCLYDLAFIANIAWLFTLIKIPTQNFAFIVNLGFVWLFFKAIILIARCCLVENVHDRAGHDVRLFYSIKWTFGIGGIIIGLTVFLHQLPIIYELKDLFNRLFLLFLLLGSIFLLKAWDVIPSIIASYIDERRTYLKKIIRILGFLIPLIFLMNSTMGLFGYVNLVFTISWYQSVFLLVLVGYLIVKGLIHDAMEWISRIFIRHIGNGWLWTEAFLKPLDRILQLISLLSAGVVLFLIYGWDEKSPVVERITKLLNYQMFDLLNTSITPVSIIEVMVVISLLVWAARWTREFVYRLLASRTHDLGLRNSIAILSQYMTVILGIFICLRVLGIDFRALTFVASALAFGVGLGLRDLVNNFACGLLLLIERPIRVGDIITINGCEGDVMHIGGRAITIRTWDHTEILIPNAEIFSKSFTNWTAKDNIIRATIPIKIDRHDNPQVVQKIISEVLLQQKLVLNDPVPEVFMKEMSDGLIEFEVRYYLNVQQVKSRLGLRSEVLIKIWEEFERQGIKPPYPNHEVHFKSAIIPSAQGIFTE